MKKILLLAILPMLFFACSKEEINPAKELDKKELDKDDNTVEENTENFYDKYCYGFIVNDTVNLQVLGKSDFQDNVILSGRKNDKLWVSLFNRDTKICIKEYVSNNVFPNSQSIYIGYGESKKYDISSMKVVDFYETNKGFAAKLDCNDQLISYVFLSGDCKYYFLRIQYGSASSKLFKWFDGSYIARINLASKFLTNDAYTCFSFEGDTLFTKKSNFYITDTSFPIDYYDFVQFYQMYNFDEKNIRPCVSALKYGLREDTNYKKADIYILSDEKDRFEISYKENILNNLYFSLFVNKYNNEKDSVNYRLDLEKWDFEIID